MNVGGNLQVFGFVEGSIVWQQYVEFSFIVFRQLIQKHLKVLGVALRQFQQQVSAIEGRKRAVQVSGFKAMLKKAKRFDGFGRKAFMSKGQQAEAAFICTVEIETLEALAVLADAVYFRGDFFLNASTAA